MQWMRSTSATSTRFIFLPLLAASVACGLVFSPGDYSEPSSANAPETGIPQPLNDGNTPIQNETGPGDAGPPSKQVLLIGGRRPSLPNETAPVFVAETMRVPISATGGIGAITFDSAPPVAVGYTRVLRLDQNPLILQRDTNTIYRADFTGGRLTTDWTTLGVRGGTVENFQRGWVTDAGLISAGGFASNNTATTNVYRALFNFGDGGVDAWTMLTPKLTRARGDVTLYRHNNFLYAIGGRENTGFSASGRDTVEVALIGADGLPAAFEATEPLLNPTTMAAHNVFVPPVASGKGYLFVIGGQTTANPAAITDIVLAAKINETTGKLDKWIAAPKLPTTLTSAAVIVIDNSLFVFGGVISQTELSDTILSLAINPSDGSLGTEWRAVGKLPGPRSNLAAMEIPTP
jgi:hypothetical protein